MFRYSVLPFLTVFLMFAGSLQADEVGSKIPHDLALKDQAGTVQGFDALSGEKGIVLVFVRSADWCPYCQVQLIDLRDNAKPIEEAGYNVVTISYDAPEVLQKFANKYDFPYVMLSDEGSKAIRTFDILNTQYDEGHFAHGVPYPHVYVISKDQHVQADLVKDGYKDRPEITAILEAIKGLN